MIRIDLHVHTKFSGDSSINPRRIVDQLCMHPFIKGVAITDHDTLEGYVQVCKLARVYEDIIIIPGVEVTTLEGHIVILGVEENPHHLREVDEVIDFARAVSYTHLTLPTN